MAGKQITEKEIETQIEQKNEETVIAENEKTSTIKGQLSSQNESHQLDLQEKVLLNLLKRQIENRINHNQPHCCQHSPHETFPGIAHYLIKSVDVINQSSTYSASPLENTPINNNNDQTTHKLTVLFSDTQMQFSPDNCFCNRF